MPGQWPRALLRAALREVGYDAIGAPALKPALQQAESQEGRGPVRLVVLDQDALTDADGTHLEDLRSSGIPIVLLAPVMRRAREGPWTRVLRRPITIGSLAESIETLVPLESEARHPTD